MLNLISLFETFLFGVTAASGLVLRHSLESKTAAYPKQTRPLATPVPIVVSNSTPPIVVTGDEGSIEGIFDPSAVVSVDSVFMTYSSVPAANLIRTRLAALEGSATAPNWKFMSEINEPYDASLPGTSCPGGMCNGTVVHEVSSLMLDPTDPRPEKRVKVR